MEFNIVDKLLGMTLIGAEWVLWLLLILSVLSVAIIIERAVFFSKIRQDFNDFSKRLADLLSTDDYKSAQELCEKEPGVEAQVALRGLGMRDRGAKAMEGAMEGFIAAQKSNLDRGLVVLGTLGNNAPFIGLFGTVIGIIKAFNDLSINPEGGPGVVMAGISEALVATAVGLLVAIPAVVAFNAFNRVVKRKVANAQAVIRVIMTYQQGA